MPVSFVTHVFLRAERVSIEQKSLFTCETSRFSFICLNMKIITVLVPLNPGGPGGPAGQEHAAGGLAASAVSGFTSS